LFKILFLKKLFLMLTAAVEECLASRSSRLALSEASIATINDSKIERHQGLIFEYGVGFAKTCGGVR
jgi:hypothetical protein